MSQGKQMTRRRFHVMIWRRGVTALLLLLQMGVLIYTIFSNSRESTAVYLVLSLLSFFTALHVLTRKDKSAFKLTWIFLILLFPIFGGLFYWLFHSQHTSKGLSKRLQKIDREGRESFYLVKDGYEKACQAAPEHKAEMRYLQTFSGFPVYQNTQTEYYPLGEVALPAMLEEMEKAESYIFLEYFIIEEGEMWDAMLEVLKGKAAQGVDVRLIYDDVGCFLLLPKEYPEILRDCGIRCHIFNPFRPFLTTVQNNRSHRKILCIDGKVAFTGGINLADEYINRRLKFGHWKDCAVKLEGNAAWSFTMMFLEMWELLDGKKEEYGDYLPPREEGLWTAHDGFVQPYCDSPLDTENVSEHVYMRIIEKAREYLYITTPYLVLDDSMVSALVLAAKSGVDVRIITPYVPDKKLVQFVSRSYYRDLVRAGVRIFEYEKGFVHSKLFVSDDEVATIGTVNLDFRALYLHFECGAWFCGCRAVNQVKEDILELLPQCIEVREEDTKAALPKRFFQAALRLAAPLI